jgi:F-type H+-transporting ATPase subunit a
MLQTFARSDVLAQAAETQSSQAAPSPQPELVFYLFGLPVTNTIFTAWVVIILLALFVFFSLRNLREIPSGWQGVWEMIVELWEGVADRTMGHWRGRRLMPLVATAFIYILFSNWFGALPISFFTIKNPDGETVPLLRSVNSDLNSTAAMAVIMILLAEGFELFTLGPLSYLKGLFIPNPMRWLEIFTRPLSLSFRLFGNIFAGEVLLATMLVVAPYVMFVFIGVELFVGVIQALIFSMLSLVFLSIGTAHWHAHGEHAHAESGSDEGVIATETQGQIV